VPADGLARVPPGYGGDDLGRDRLVKTTPICPVCGSTDVRRHGEYSTCDRCSHTGHNYRFTGRGVRPSKTVFEFEGERLELKYGDAG
jgi:hypothetical protein